MRLIETLTTRHLFFDLDGTLTDSRVGIVRCITHALSTLGQTVPTEEELETWIGPPLLASFARQLGSDALATQALEHYRERFARIGLLENSVYAGIPEILSQMSDRNLSLVVVTSKPQVYAKRIVAHFGLDRHLRGVFGSELDGTRSDKGELIAHTLESLSIGSEHAIMIGDREHDVIGARKSSVYSIGVMWGFGSREELLDSGADAICDRVVDLASLVDARW